MIVRLALALTGLIIGLLLVLAAPGEFARHAQREAAHRHNALGVALLEQYDYAGAVAAFRDALLADDGLPIARHNLALALYYEGQLEAAATAAREASAAMPDSPHGHYLQGLIGRATGDLDEARTAFTRVLAVHPADAGAAIQLAQLHTLQQQYLEAATLFERAVGTEPFNATAAYGLATALNRSGDSAAAKVAMTRFERLRDDGAAVTYSRTYSQEGRYGEALAATGLEAVSIDRSRPAVSFVAAPAALDRTMDTPADRPPQLLGTAADGAAAGAAGALAAAATRLTGGVTLADLDRDGALELVVVTATELRLHRRAQSGFTLEARVPISGTTAVSAVAGDVDNDGRPDLFVVGYPEHRLLRQDADGTFSDAGLAARLPSATALARAAVLADIDHDGDIDIVVAGLAAPEWRQPPDGVVTFPGSFAAARLQVIRNNGNGTFLDVTGDSRLGEAARAGVAVVATDFDNRRDIDLLVVPFGGVPALYRNQRDGTFHDVAPSMGWPEGAYTAIAAGDVNKDRFTDFFLGRREATGLLALSDGAGGFTFTAAPAGSGDTLASQFLDYDNDGILDLLLLTATGPRLFRNLGGEWNDVTAGAFPRSGAAAADLPIAFASGDVDRDGDVDVIVSAASGRVVEWRNDGASRRRSVAVQLEARVSNRSAVGATTELRSGSLYQKVESFATTPAVAPSDHVFGLGRRAHADVVRVVWPAGIVQAEAIARPAVTVNRLPLTVVELDRKPSSCPYLFVWNGSRFEFLTDFLGGGELGYWVAPGVRNVPDPDEYVRIPPGLLAPRDGRYELRVTNELEEALFLDRSRLIAVDHPAGTAIYPHEGLRSPPYRVPFELHTVQDARVPQRAVDHHGHDVLDRIAREDRVYVDDFRLEPVQGYAEAHSITLELDPGAAAGTILLLTGWTDYSFSSDNVAAAQAGLAFRPPELQMRDQSGTWQTVIAEIGLPVGRPQTVAVDLTSALTQRGAGRPAGTPLEIRIVTTLRVYWDQVLVGTAAAATPRLTSLDPLAARLTPRGFSAAQVANGHALGFDYADVSPNSPWKTLPGHYTRAGDVRRLLLDTDDRFVIAAPGDDLALSFDAAALPALAAGWTRTFLLHADGFSKEMNVHSSSPDRLEPLPFHAMTAYPYPESEHYPRTPDHDGYRREYNTRAIGGPLPPLERILLPRAATPP